MVLTEPITVYSILKEGVTVNYCRPLMGSSTGYVERQVSRGRISQGHPGLTSHLSTNAVCLEGPTSTAELQCRCYHHFLKKVKIAVSVANYVPWRQRKKKRKQSVL